MALTTAASAQQYPTKPVRLIIPFPPGGSNDVVGRLIATQLAKRLGQQVGRRQPRRRRRRDRHEAAAQAPADGYTLLMISVAHAGQSLALEPNAATIRIKSFAPVAMLGTGPNVLAVNPGLPAKIGARN